jgi:hypothetical protein
MLHNLTLFKLPITEYYKGGSSPPPAPPDYAAESRARQEEANNQARIDDQRAATAKAAADTQHANDVSASQGRVASAYGAAQGYGRSKLSAKGLDPTAGYGQQILNEYQSSLDRAKSGAPEIVQDASSLFGPSLYDTAYGDVRSSARNDYNKKAGSFIGDGFDTNTWNDNADDSILQSILGDQRTEAQTSLDRALARGTINDVGYNTGKKTLGNEYTAGLAKANQTGLGVLSGYRKDLNDFAGNVHNKIDNYDFGDDLNLDNYHNQLDQKVAGQKGSLEGDILAAIGGTNYFDTDTILGKAGNASGVTNNTVSPNPLGAGTGSSNGLAPTSGYLTTAASDPTSTTNKNVGF